ncbi:hypothetical protein LJK87_38490 [Paenibacillus sp. P25]|nr:hypothetical protein LJK87_38490 [Paenibacillus sp. P25]
MNKAVKGLAMGSLLLTLAFGAVGAASAETTSSSQGGTEAGQTAATVAAPDGKPHVVFFKGPGAGLLQHPALERNYLQSLANTYTPDQAAPGKRRWRTASRWRRPCRSRKRRSRASISGRSVRVRRGRRISLPEKVLEKLPELQEGKPGDKPFRIMIRAKGPEGADTVVTDTYDAVPAVPSIPPIDGELPDGIIKKESPPELKAELQPQEDFVQAVESENEASIRELLPKPLENYKAKTEELKKLAEQLREKLQKSEPQTQQQ